MATHVGTPPGGPLCGRGVVLCATIWYFSSSRHSHQQVSLSWPTAKRTHPAGALIFEHTFRQSRACFHAVNAGCRGSSCCPCQLFGVTSHRCAQIAEQSRTRVHRCECSTRTHIRALSTHGGGRVPRLCRCRAIQGVTHAAQTGFCPHSKHSH